MSYYHTPDDRAAFAERLKTLIKEKRMSPYRLALNLGVSQTIVGHWVKAENFPSPDNLAKLANYLETTVEYLENGEENTQSASEISQDVGRPLTFAPLAVRASEEEPGVVGPPNGDDRRRAEIRPLSLAEAKQGLAATFGVSVDAIEITIRG